MSVCPCLQYYPGPHTFWRVSCAVISKVLRVCMWLYICVCVCAWDFVCECACVCLCVYASMHAVSSGPAYSLAFFVRHDQQGLASHRITLRHTAIHCSALQLTAAYCNTLQHTATHCSTLQNTAAHCSTLQHTATH